MQVSTNPAWTKQIQIRRLGGALGAELHGIDIAALRDGDVETIHQALIDHHVVAIRNQDIEAGNLDSFSRQFGPRMEMAGEVRKRLGHPQYPDVIMVENKGYVKAYTNRWHSDTCYSAITPSFTMLAAYQLPEAGGGTLFANQHLAFETLSPALQEMLKPLSAENTINLQHDEGRTDSRAVHPVVRIHPVTGRRALFVNEVFTRNFVGMSIEESKGLLQYLFNHSVQPEFSYQHRYEPGDLVIWDNRSVLHRAIQDYGDEERVMFHMEAMPDRPV